MSQTVKRFGYTILKRVKKEDRPFNPIVKICLKYWSHTEDGIPIVSPELIHEREIDHHIEALKKDLDAVGKRAKEALKRAKNKTF